VSVSANFYISLIFSDVNTIFAKIFINYEKVQINLSEPFRPAAAKGFITVLAAGKYGFYVCLTWILHGFDVPLILKEYYKVRNMKEKEVKIIEETESVY
jgi:hypothetical protein